MLPRLNRKREPRRAEIKNFVGVTCNVGLGSSFLFRVDRCCGVQKSNWVDTYAIGSLSFISADDKVK